MPVQLGHEDDQIRSGAGIGGAGMDTKGAGEGVRGGGVDPEQLAVGELRARGDGANDQSGARRAGVGRGESADTESAGEAGAEGQAEEVNEGDGEPSPASQLIRLFRKRQGYQQGRSRERREAGMRAVVQLAIRYGLRFDRHDFVVMTRDYEGIVGGRKGGIRLDVREREYAIACGDERGRLNPSAAQAYEHWHKRKPFLIEDEGSETPTRMYEGRKFKWYGKRATCTSFADDLASFTACTYKPPVDGEYGRKIDKRYRITRDDIREHRLCRKLAGRIVEHCTPLPKDDLKAFSKKINKYCDTTSLPEMKIGDLKWVAELVGLPEPSPEHPASPSTRNLRGGL